MSTTLRLQPAVKKMSSWVRPGVRDMRARFLRPVSALIRLDFPTLDLPAKAISTPRIGGSDAGVPAAATKRHSPAKSCRPASSSVRVNWADVIGAGYPSASCQRSSRASTSCSLATVKTWMAGTSPGHDVERVCRCYDDAFFFTNNALMLSNNSILAPCLRMMTLCCSTDSELFHAQ